MKNKDNRPEQAASSAGAGQARREQVEEIVRGKAAHSKEDLDALSPEETRRLLHELRVRQSEIEAQNEELSRVLAEVDAVRARYFDLYDMAPVGYCTVSEKGLILEANRTAATLLGAARDTLVKQPISRFIHKKDQDIYYLFRKQLLEVGEFQKCELRIIKKDGTAFWASLVAILEQGIDNAIVCRIIISDITDRKRIDEVQTFLAQTCRSTPDESFFNSLARFLGEKLEMNFVCIDRLEGDGLTARTVAVRRFGGQDGLLLPRQCFPVIPARSGAPGSAGGELCRCDALESYRPANRPDRGHRTQSVGKQAVGRKYVEDGGPEGSRRD